MTIGNVSAMDAVIQPQVARAAKKAVQQQKVDLSDPVDKLELSSKINEAADKKAKKGKKVLSGVASAAIPGLGQFINGDKMKGLMIFAGDLGIRGWALGGLTTLGLNPAVLAVGLGVLAIYETANIIDAVKTAK